MGGLMKPSALKSAGERPTLFSFYPIEKQPQRLPKLSLNQF